MNIRTRRIALYQRDSWYLCRGEGLVLVLVFLPSLWRLGGCRSGELWGVEVGECCGGDGMKAVLVGSRLCEDPK